MSELRAAIIGYGLAGAAFHGPLLAATPGVTVTTVVTSDPERQAAARREHPGVRLLDHAEELWADAAELDLVVVAAPNRAHAPLARRAIELGLAVVVDKPLAVTAADARALVALARERAVLLTVFQNRRWDADQMTLRRLLADGPLGDVLHVESRMERWRPQLRGGVWRESRAPEDGGGVLLDLGSHLVDQALALFGPATEVYAEVATRRAGSADDDAFLALRHASGVASRLWASLVCPAPGPRLRVLGREAAYLLEAVDTQEDALRAGRRPGGAEPWGVEPEERWGRLIAGERSEPVPTEPGAWTAFYPAVVSALRDGTPPPVDPADAVATLELLEAGRTSAAERRVVALSE
ncbi:MAG: oxidoreductase domain protein [Conexibacter sp.]|nr:oxidoreductase domain protein [Conexibacter sp.]